MVFDEPNSVRSLRAIRSATWVLRKGSPPKRESPATDSWARSATILSSSSWENGTPLLKLHAASLKQWSHLNRHPLTYRLQRTPSPSTKENGLYSAT